MPGVWFCVERLLTAPRVPIRNEFWISSKRFRSRELFRSELAPESGLRVPKSGEPALRGNSRACKGDDFFGVAQRFDERGREIHHAVAPNVGFGAVFPCILLHSSSLQLSNQANSVTTRANSF